MAIWDRIREIRQQAGLNQSALARKVGVTSQFINSIEKPGVIPPIKLLHKLAKAVTHSEEERGKLEADLIIERSLAQAPKNVRRYLSAERMKTVFDEEEGMPVQFLERLKKDIENNRTQKHLLERTSVIEALAGRYTLSKTHVRRLAVALGQPVDDYLILAGYIPDSEGLKVILRTVSGVKLDEKLTESIKSVVTTMIDIYTKDKVRR